MTHKWDGSGPSCMPLSSFKANGGTDGSHLLLRVVSVNDSGKLTLPARELWCKLEGNMPSDKLNFTIFQAHTWDHGEEESGITFEEANEAICSGRPWFGSQKSRLPDSVAGASQWYITSLVRGSPSIWKKMKSTRSGDVHYKLHEANLRAWLANGGGDIHQLDDEEDWWCLTHNSSDEGPLKTVKKRSPPAGDADDDNDEERSGFDRDDQLPGGDDDDEVPSEPAEEDRTSAGVDDGESSKYVDDVQILDEDDLDDDTEQGGVRLTPEQMNPARRFNFTLVACEAEATDNGYDGDA